jgi:hypothetical protein
VSSALPTGIVSHRRRWLCLACQAGRSR